MTSEDTNDRPAGRFPLADVLAEIGEEFRRAEELATGHPEGPMVAWQGATLELQTVLTKEGSGRVRAWVVEAGGGVSQAETVKISVHLSPWSGQPIAGGK